MSDLQWKLCEIERQARERLAQTQMDVELKIQIAMLEYACMTINQI